MAIFRLDPLRHVLRTFMLVMTQHGPGEVIAPVVLKIGATSVDAFNQRRAVARLQVTLGQQLLPVLLGLLPGLRVLVQLNRGSGNRAGALFNGPGPWQVAVHAFSADRRGHVGRAAEHGIGYFAFDACAKSQWRHAHAGVTHDGQRIFGPVEHEETLRRVVQGGGFRRGVGAIHMQLRRGQLLANQGPDMGLHP